MLITDTADVPPLTRDLNQGYSWGLEYPIIYGWRPDRNFWAAWDRHTGEIKAYAAPQTSTTRYDPSMKEVKEYSMPKDYNQNPFTYDAIP